jgi:hypothetical protein
MDSGAWWRTAAHRRDFHDSITVGVQSGFNKEDEESATRCGRGGRWKKGTNGISSGYHGAMLTQLWLAYSQITLAFDELPGSFVCFCFRKNDEVGARLEPSE